MAFHTGLFSFWIVSFLQVSFCIDRSLLTCHSRLVASRRQGERQKSEETYQHEKRPACMYQKQLRVVLNTIYTVRLQGARQKSKETYQYEKRPTQKRRINMKRNRCGILFWLVSRALQPHSGMLFNTLRRLINVLIRDKISFVGVAHLTRGGRSGSWALYRAIQYIP